MTDNWTAPPRRSTRPLVLVDIDGVLNPRKNQAERGFTPYRLKGEDELVWLSQEHGRMLNELDSEGQVDLRWGTTWNDAANRTVGPAIGLQRDWDVVPIDRAMAGPVVFGYNWKAVSIRAGADGQPFAWLDDFMTEADRLWAEDRVFDEGIPTLLLRIDPDVGLQPGHLDQVRDWAASTQGPGPLTADDLLRRTPDLASDPEARHHAEWLSSRIAAMPTTVANGDGTLDRSELATTLWDRTAHAVASERVNAGAQQPTDDFSRQALRRYLRGDGASALVWADRAALRAATPHGGHVRPAGPHEHRLVLPTQPGREHGYQVQALIDSAVGQIGTSPEWQRVQKSVQLGPDSPTVLVNIRADRKNTSTNLTVAFGNSGADRIPYEQVLREGPDALLERVRTASDYEIEPLELEAVNSRQAGPARETVLSPLTDPAMMPPGSARPAAAASNLPQSEGTRAAQPRRAGAAGHEQTMGS